jgi:hypothetical protein
MSFYEPLETSESVGKIDYEMFRVRCRYKMERKSGFTWSLWELLSRERGWIELYVFICRQKP